MVYEKGTSNARQKEDQIWALRVEWNKSPNNWRPAEDGILIANKRYF
jgi:hypothetical protein